METSPTFAATIPPDVAAKEPVIVLEQGPLGALEAQDTSQRIPLWRRVGACVATGAVLAAGACSSAPEKADESVKAGVSAVASAAGAIAQDARSKLKAADAGPLHMGIIVVRPTGIQKPGFGITEYVATQAATRAEDAITVGTGGAVQFAKPDYYGSVNIEVPNPEDACPMTKDPMPPKAFSKAMRDGALEEARAKGYKDRDNAGLLMYVDVNCGKFIHSFASQVGGIFEPDNIMYISGDPRQKRSTEVHEISHELGLDHADRLLQGRNELPDEFGANDGNYDYGNPRSVMGQLPQLDAAPVAKYNGYELYTLGAIDVNEVNAITQPGQYNVTLTDIDSRVPGDDVKLTRMPRTPNVNDKLSNWWIELSRAPETAKNPEPSLGVSVYAGDTATSKHGDHTYLATTQSLDSPGVGAATSGFTGSTIFQDPAIGLSVKLNHISEETGKANVSIRYTGEPEPPIAP